MMRLINKLLIYLGVAPILRLLANFILLFAAIALISDVAKTLESEETLVVTPMLHHVQEVAPRVFLLFQDWVGRTLPAFVWDPVIEQLLRLPTWGLLGSVAIFLFWIGRRREPVNVYVN